MKKMSLAILVSMSALAGAAYAQESTGITTITDPAQIQAIEQHAQALQQQQAAQQSAEETKPMHEHMHMKEHSKKMHHHHMMKEKAHKAAKKAAEKAAPADAASQ